MKTAQSAGHPPPRTHATLSPRTNLLLICVWAIAVGAGFVFVQPPLPLGLAIAGGLCGALAGIMQHLSIKQDPTGFLAASSLMGVRSALTKTPWGRKYIAWLYFSKFALALLAFLLQPKSLLYRILLGYLIAYFSLMLVRDAITLKDTFTLYRLRDSAPSSPVASA